MALGAGISVFLVLALILHRVSGTPLIKISQVLGFHSSLTPSHLSYNLILRILKPNLHSATTVDNSHSILYLSPLAAWYLDFSAAYWYLRGCLSKIHPLKFA